LIYSVSKAVGFVKELARIGSGMKKSSITSWTLALRDRSLEKTFQEEALDTKGD
jgi:hypothetical protein